MTVPGHSAADSGSVQNQGTEQAAGGAAGEEEPGTPLSSNGAAARGGGLKGHITVEDGEVVECLSRLFVRPDGNDAWGEGAGREAGQDGSAAAPDPDPAADGVTARGIAERLIHNMSPAVRQDFVRATIEASSLNPDVVEATVANMKKIGAQLLGDGIGDGCGAWCCTGQTCLGKTCPVRVCVTVKTPYLGCWWKERPGEMLVV